MLVLALCLVYFLLSFFVSLAFFATVIPGWAGAHSRKPLEQVILWALINNFLIGWLAFLLPTNSVGHGRELEALILIRENPGPHS